MDIKEYSAHGVFFAYPTNWELEESEMGTASGNVQLTNETGAFWILKKYPFGTNPEEIAQEAVKAMREEYEDMEIDRIEMTLFDKSITGFDMTFFFLDLMNAASILCFEDAGITYAVFWQTGNQLIIQADESVPVEKVLEAITYSLLSGANK